MRQRWFYDDVLQKVAALQILPSSSRHLLAYLNAADENHHCPHMFGITGSQTLTIDLDAPYTVKGFGVWHNVQGYGAVQCDLWVGTLDNGSTFDLQIGTITFTGNPWTEPCVVMALSLPYSKRYWRWRLLGTPAENKIGRLALFLEILDMDQAPDTPYRTGTRGGAVEASTEDGRTRRRKLTDRQLTTGMRYASLSEGELADLEAIREAQGGSEHPVWYAEHTRTQSNPAPARYARIIDLSSKEIRPGGRFQVDLTLEDCE